MKPTLLLALGAAIATASAGDPIKNPIIPCEGAASCGLVGDLTIGASYTSLDGSPITSSEEDEFAAAYAELQLGWQVGDYFVQADVFTEITDVGSANDSYRDGFGGALHVMRRDDARGLGAFIGGFSTDQDNGSSDTTDRWFGGLEGQLFRPEADYYLQLGYIFGEGGTDSNGEDSLHDAIFARATATKELQCGLVLTGEIGGAWGEMDADGSDFDLYTIGISASKPISEQIALGLAYQFTYYDQGGDEDDQIDEHFVGINFTYFFGGDAAGNSADLGTPDFLRWSGISGGQLE